MRPTVLALVALLAVPALAGVLPAGAASATAVTSSGLAGIYHPVDRVRALDTRSTGAIPAHGTVVVRVSDRGEVPAADVVAISANLTVLSPGSTGSLSAYADGTSWSGATMSFQAGQTAQNFETIPVSGGLIDIRNNTAGPLNVIVDLLGYHLLATDSDTKGRYTPISPTRLLDTRTSQPVAAGESRNFRVASVGGIPPAGSLPGEMAAVINFTVLAPSQPGSLTVGLGNANGGNTPSLSFAAGQTEQSQVLMSLDGSGVLRIRNNSGAAIQVIADAVGYYTGLFGDEGKVFWAGSSYRRGYDSRAPGKMLVPPGGTVYVNIYVTLGDFWPGPPPLGINAGSFNVTVLNPTTSGSISVWPESAVWDGAGTVSFTAGKTSQRMLMAKADSIGTAFRNNSSAPITLIVDINGWSTSS